MLACFWSKAAAFYQCQPALSHCQAAFTQKQLTLNHIREFSLFLYNFSGFLETIWDSYKHFWLLA
jgi:hypothetical protein